MHYLHYLSFSSFSQLLFFKLIAAFLLIGDSENSDYWIKKKTTNFFSPQSFASTRNKKKDFMFQAQCKWGFFKK